MTVPEREVSANEILGKWVHSHEEDPNDGSLREVYRPAGWKFGPSRGRRGFDLCKGNRASYQAIAPADGSVESAVEWQLESGNELVFFETDREVRRMRIESVEPNRMVLREVMAR